MAVHPTGTVTFFFTDIEGSTRRWEQFREAMAAALARHDDLVRAAIVAHGGHVFKTMGDAFCAAFGQAPEAVAAALTAQRALVAEDWSVFGADFQALRVRMALHTGSADARDGDYFGPPLNRVARLLSTGHGGQVLLSLATQELVRDDLPQGVSLKDLGQHRLKDLRRPEHVFQMILPDLPGDFPPLNTLDTRPNNLPVQVSSFVGREREMADVRQQLEAARLVTITGPGGTGKTRLALQVAAELVTDFAHGVFWVPLASLHDPALVVVAIGEATEVEVEPGEPVLDALKAFLRRKQMLLVLDNFEQVFAAAPVVAALLEADPGLKVLVTSRQPLRVRGEREYPVSPLPVPDAHQRQSVETLAQYAAVQLFIQRAVEVRPGFAVTIENAPAIAEICTRLDGLPLAIELAAARVKVLPPNEILRRLTSRLKLLTGGARDLPARQQTMRDAIAWSYDLLAPADQRLFRRLGVFEGGWTLEAAEAVGDPDGDVDVFDCLASLVDKSLVRQTETEDASRFWMLGTIREFAVEQLAESGEAEAVRDAHLRWCVSFGESADAGLDGPEMAAWLARLIGEEDNVRAALDWAEARDEGDLGLRLACQTFGARQRATRHVTRDAFEHLVRLLALPSAQPATRVRLNALLVAGRLAQAGRDHATAHRHLEAALQLARTLGEPAAEAETLAQLGELASVGGTDSAEEAVRLAHETVGVARSALDPPHLAGLLSKVGWAVLRAGDRALAQEYLDESIAIFQAHGQAHRATEALHGVGMMAMAKGDYAAADDIYRRVRAILIERDDQANLSVCCHQLGIIARDRGDLATAEGFFTEVLQIETALGNTSEIANELTSLGYVTLLQGRLPAAREQFMRCMTIGAEEDNPEIILRAALGLALVAAEVGRTISAVDQFERAACLYGLVDKLDDAYYLPPMTAMLHDRHARARTETRERLGDAAFEAARAAGLALDLDTAVRYALESIDVDVGGPQGALLVGA